MRLGRIFALPIALYLLLSVPALLLAGILLVHAATWQGRLFALAVITALPAPVLMWIACYVEQKLNLLHAASVTVVSSFLLLAADYSIAPDNHQASDSRIHSIRNTSTPFRRASPSNLVPEIDQLILGTYVMPSLDRLMDKPNTAELRQGVRDVYGEMLKSRDFERLGSALDYTYRDIFLGERPVGHLYEYIPNRPGPERLPVVIFLHGSLGNFRGYMWVWKKIADAHGFAVVAPSFGTGNWDAPDGSKALEQARRYCLTNPRFDAERIFLAGLSNGGRGVCMETRASPGTYRGAIFISPVLDSQLWSDNQFLATWKDKPLLVIHGSRDNRIPAAYVTPFVKAMQDSGLRVTYRLYEGQTHFLFFTIRHEVQDLIGQWLSASAAGPRRQP
jgi:pimeloyl-ACP methyl ester carboxylesterase